MAAWVLSDATWDTLEQKNDISEVISRKQISWHWIDITNDNGDSKVTGDFFIRDHKNTSEEAFCITANAYIDLRSEIEGGDRVTIIDYDRSWPEQYREFANWFKGYVGPDLRCVLSILAVQPFRECRQSLYN